MSSARILIVDDDPALLDALAGALRLRMPEVAIDNCDSASAALQRISEIDYDAVVTDIKMPGMDGLALLQEIQAVEPELPTLLITGHGQHDLAVQALRGGAFDFIQKPIERDYFVASLSRAVRVRQMGRQIQEQQRAMRQHAEQLEQEVYDRTEELREANRRKDEFLAVLSHELRNPLACILSAADLVRLSEGDPQYAGESCRVIAQQARQMSRLLDDLLDLSRISRNAIELRKTSLPLEEIIDAAVAATQSTILSRGHEFTVRIDESVRGLVVFADSTRLEQVIVNLLNNAARYTPPGGTIRLEALRDDSQIVLRVEDDGMGIPSSLLPHVFEPFVRSDEARRQTSGGLGIGLSLVRQLVELHGGTVAVNSDGKGKGSCFTLRLPNSLPQKAVQPGKADPPVQTASWRILLVEDQTNLAKMMQLLLEHFGQEVVAVAADGRRAIEAALTHRPDLILLDIGLPGMDGYEVARRIRDYPQLNQTVLVAVTGYGRPEDRRKSRAAGFDYHLVKPCTVESLAEVLRSADREEVCATRD